MKKIVLLLSLLLMLSFTFSLTSCDNNGGNFIKTIEKTSTDGLVDTYTIRYSDGSTYTFTVTNGEDGVDGIQGEPGKDGHTPVITIGENGNWYIDGVDTGKRAEGIKGDIGNGIASIEKTSSEGLVDIYTITFTDGTTTTFTVTNGANGIDGIQGEPGKNGHTPIITIGENGNWYVDGVDTGKRAEVVLPPHYDEKHTVTFHLNGGSLPIGYEETIEVSWGDTLDLPIPTKYGYNFIGWFTGDDVNDKKFSSYDAVFRDLDLYAKYEVTVKTQFNAYDDSGLLLDSFNSFFEALDELFVTGNLKGIIKPVIKDVEGDAVYSGTNGFSYSWFDENGLSKIFDDGEKIKNGQFSWYQNYELDLKIHTQDKASMMFQASSNAKNIGKFFARPADFETTNTDGSGGYHPSGDPDGMWTGWRASVYKAGVTTAQYLSWADNSGAYDKMDAVYDLTKSTISPSNNPNQPVRAEIWMGSPDNSNVTGAEAKYSHVIMGISFDAGTVDSTKYLADGTKREVRLFSEVVALNGGMVEAYMGERVYGDTVGYATWNKSKGVWEFDSKYNMSLVFKNIGSKGVYILTVNEKTLTFDFGYEVKFNGNLRLTYGVSLTPDTYQNNRKVPDLRNGSEWLNVVQESIVKGFTTKADVANMGFMDGRVANGANQIGIYGGDVCDVIKNVEGHAVFTFKY